MRRGYKTRCSIYVGLVGETFSELKGRSPGLPTQLMRVDFSWRYRNSKDVVAIQPTKSAFCHESLASKCVLCY